MDKKNVTLKKSSFFSYCNKYKIPKCAICFSKIDVSIVTSITEMFLMYFFIPGPSKKINFGIIQYCNKHKFRRSRHFFWCSGAQKIQIDKIIK